MELLLKLLLLPIWLPLKLIGELLERSIPRRNRHYSGSLSTFVVFGCIGLGSIALVGLVALFEAAPSIGLLANKLVPWMFIVFVPVGVVVIAVRERRRLVGRVRSERSQLRAASPLVASGTCAICGAASTRMSRVTRADREGAIRVCANCSEKVSIEGTAEARKAMHLLDGRGQPAGTA